MAASPALAVVLRDDFVAAYERELPAVVHRPVIRAADRWRGIQVGEFEQWQLRALRDALNRAHAQRVAPAVSRPTSPVVRKLRK